MYKKILIINLGGIGDVLLSQPALKALKLKYPECKIDMLTSDKVSSLVEPWNYIESKHYIRLNYRQADGFINLLRGLSVLRHLRSQKYEVLINMRTLYSLAGALKMRFLLWVIKAKKTIGRNTDNRGKFFDQSIFEDKIGIKHESFYDIETVNLLGVDGELSFDFKINNLVEEKIRNRLNLDDRKLLVWHLGGMPSRRYSLESVQRVVDKIDSKIFRVVFVSGAGENFTLKAELVSDLDFEELSSLVSIADLFISNDTGPMHLAAVLKKKQLALMGPGDFKRFDPRVINEKAEVLRGMAECAPCEKYICKNNYCINSIDIMNIVDWINKDRG